MASSDDVSALPFFHVCELLQHLEDGSRQGAQAAGKDGHKKRQRGWRWKLLHAFRERFCPPTRKGSFSLWRLVIPDSDKERSVYNMKESALAGVIVSALGLQKGVSKDALRLENWRQEGSTPYAGNFARAVEETCREYLQTEGDRTLTIREVNSELDQLSAAGTTDERAAVLRRLLDRMDPSMVKWTVKIILKSMKVGVNLNYMMNFLHEDAMDMFNICCDLREICEKVEQHPRPARWPRMAIQVGNVVMAQRCFRKNSVEDAVKAMGDSAFLLETKFDGERIQMHRDGGTINYFTRNLNDFGPRGYNVFDPVLNQVLPSKCILDGELLVWNKRLSTFEEFSTLKTTMNKAADPQISATDTLPSTVGRWNDDPPALGDLEIWYMCFDVLYNDISSVIHLTLNERHRQLRQMVRPVPSDGATPLGPSGVIKGRIVLVVPDPGNPHCQISPTLTQVQEKMDQIEAEKYEGIVLKHCESKWTPDGSDKKTWIKIKPDYLPTEDLDCLVVGGNFGTGKRGGTVAQWVLGIADTAKGRSHFLTSPHFLTFCRVGTGNDDSETTALNDKLGPHLYKGKKPEWLTTTGYMLGVMVTGPGNAKETPHMWIDHPKNSVVFKVNADGRMIKSTVFASSHSLRFPRVDMIRWDKLWHDVLSVEELKEQVAAAQQPETIRQQSTQRKDSARASAHAKRLKGAHPRLPEHYVLPDLSDVTSESEVLSGLKVCCLDSGTNRAEVCKWLKAHGADVVLQYCKGVTHLIATKTTTASFQAYKKAHSIYTLTYLQECVACGSMLQPFPRHRLHYAGDDAELDRFGDGFCTHVDAADVRALLRQVTSTSRADSTAEDMLTKRRLIVEEPSLVPTDDVFRGCSILWVQLEHSLIGSSAASSAVATSALDELHSSMRLQIQLRGGIICPAGSLDATHLVVAPGLQMPGSISSDSGRGAQQIAGVLRGREREGIKQPLKVVTASWAEDTIRHRTLQPEDNYPWAPPRE